jgi:hypothetical protein
MLIADITEDVRLSASPSRDPDADTNQQNLAYAWYCTKTDIVIDFNDPTTGIVNYIMKFKSIFIK